MKSFKWLLIVLASMGVISLGACSNGQQVDNSGNNPAVSSSKTTTAGQMIEPATQTGEARMTLNPEGEQRDFVRSDQKPAIAKTYISA